MVMLNLCLTRVFCMSNVSANAPDDPGQNVLQSWLPVPVPGVQVVGSHGTASHQRDLGQFR